MPEASPRAGVRAEPRRGDTRTRAQRESGERIDLMKRTKVETSILFKFLYFVFPFGLVIYKLILCINTHIAHVVGISFSIKYAHTSTMKKIGFAIIGTLTLFFVIVLLSIYPHEPEESRYIRVNDGIFLSEEYNVADSFTGSSITGTILA